MSRDIRKVWDERILADEIERGAIRQFCAAIVPRSMGQTFGGFRTNLTMQDCDDLIAALDHRVAADGGPKVTAAQAEYARGVLVRNHVRMLRGCVADFATVECFRFAGFDYEDGGYRLRVAPTYRAYWPNGDVLEYTPTPWPRGSGDFSTWGWRWLKRGDR